MSVVRRAVQILAVVCILLVGMASMAVIVTQTAWFKEWMRGFIVRQASNYLNGELSIGRLDGNLFYGIELEDISVTIDGETVVAIKDAGLDYNAFSFLLGHAIIDDIRLNQPVFRLEKTAEGWNLARLVKVRTPDRPQPRRRPIEIGRIGISDGTVSVKHASGAMAGIVVPSRFERIDASLSVRSNEDALTIDVAHVSLRAKEPSLGLNALSGRITRQGDAVVFENVSLRTEETSLRVGGSVQTAEHGRRTLTLSASSDKFTTDEIGRVIPWLRNYGLQPAFEASARGPVENLSVDLDMREARLGHVKGPLTLDVIGPDRRIAGSVSMSRFNFAPLVAAHTGPRTSFASHIDGEAEFDLALPKGKVPFRGTYSIKASRAHVAGYDAQDVAVNGRFEGRVVQVDGAASAYGGRTSARGTVVIGRPVVLDLAGNAAGVDLRNLPPVFRIPRAPSNLQFGWTLQSREGQYTATAEFDQSTLAGASIVPGTTGELTFGRGAAPVYAARGKVEHLDAHQVGRDFSIGFLINDRYRSRINATFDLKGRGGGRYALVLDATGTALDSELFSAAWPRLDFTARFMEGDVAIGAQGAFAGLNPAGLVPEERAKGDLSGTLDINATIRNYAEGVTAESLDLSGQVNLTPSTIADVSIDSAIVEGTYASRQGELTRLEVAGPDVKVSGKGPIALNDTGASNLELHAETSRLDEIGRLIGQPLGGRAVVDVTFTGNAQELKLAGTLQGSQVAYGEQSALTLNSTFDVTVPELVAEHATVNARSTATFVEVAGRRINQLTADTMYSRSQLEFDAVAQEGKRELAVAGSAVLHPDHQELHLGDVTFRTEQIEWRTVPGSAAAVRFKNHRIEIDALRVASGDQQIEANGVLGSNAEGLRVHAENVDVAQLDQLLLGEQRLAGRLNADATVSGPLDAPRAEGEFVLNQGAFRGFAFESLSGKVDYVGKGVNVDVRLQQSPSARLTATGYAPLSLFRRNAEPREGHETPTEGEGIELQISSSEIDLGVVQGFTSYVTNVTGVLQAQVKVTGTGHDPHFEGIVDVRGGAFTIPDLGTTYTGLDTTIDLSPDAVNLSQMRILDEHGRVMTIGGMLAVHERVVGAVDVQVHSEGFEVINNGLADLKLDTDLRITGELRTPRIEGFVEVDSGNVDVARVLEEATVDRLGVAGADLNTPDPAGPTLATVASPAPPAAALPAPSTAASATPAAGAPAAPPPAMPDLRFFDAVQVDVGVAIPGNLTLRGDDIRTSGGSADFGDVNLTVGGALQVRKASGERLRLIGEVNTIRGSYTFQSRRFEILRDGRIRFGGTEEIDPLFDLQARRVISSVEAFVHLRGSLRQPELSFSSRPPLDQADILSLIVFNVPVNELGEGQQISLAERAGALAGGYLVSGLTRSLANALELDELELQADAGLGLGPILSIGEQIGNNLFVRIRQGFGAAEATELILEYQIAEYLRLQGSVAQYANMAQRAVFTRVERGGLDLIFFFSY
jgi:autotransporter translocation and assembly factor TamB